MKSIIRFAFALVLCAGVLSMTAQTSNAQFGYGGGWGAGYGAYGPGMWGWGWRPSPYSLGQVPVPPYFALHPPVYYSRPVARTYGYSPYAYPGWMQTPEIEQPCAPEPLTMTNPYVEQTEAVEAPAEETQDDYAVKPLQIDNPYVLDSPVEREEVALASVEYLD